MWHSIRAFYNSTQWKRVREAYKKSKQGLCERCLKRGLIVPATEVHHKVRLTSSNVNNVAISLNYSNLEALCEACHDQEHEADAIRRGQKQKKSSRRYAIDKRTGAVVPHMDEQGK